MKVNVAFDVTRWGVEISGIVDGDYFPGRAAQTYGPPERCYPAEGAEFCVESVAITSLGGQKVTIIVDDPSSFYNDFCDVIDAAADEEYRAEEEREQEAAAEQYEEEKQYRNADDKHDAQMKDLEP